MLGTPENGENTPDPVTISKGNLALRAPTFQFCSLPSSLLPYFSNSLPQTQQPQSFCFLPPKSTFRNYPILKRESDVGTQTQVPSLTSWWLWTSHIPTPGLQRLDATSGYFGCKTILPPPSTPLRPSHHQPYPSPS